MTRNSEDAPSPLPDNPPLRLSNTGGQIPVAGSVPLERVAFPSVEIIGETLCKNNVIDSPTGLLLKPIQGNPNRRDYLSKASFRVLAGERTICHLTIGRNLTQLWEYTQAFATACPEIACLPLFYHRFGEWDYLGIEFFDGANLDGLALEGRLTPAEALKHARKIIAALERTLQPSTVEAATREIDALFAQVCTLPILAEIDQTILRQIVFPFVRAGALAGPWRTRWTNGDLTPANVMVNQQGNARLVDYEFATRTHFFAEDTWRWRAFSHLPPEVSDLPGLDNIASKEPWLEAFFLLKQLVHANEISDGELTIDDAQPILDWLIAVTARTHSGFHASRFLQPLAVSSRLQQDLQQKNRTIAELLVLGRTVTDDALHEIMRLRNLVCQREAKIRAMQASFSWQATAPLRATRRKFVDPYRPQKIELPDSFSPPAVNFPHSPHDFDDVVVAFPYNIDSPSTWSALVGSMEVRGWCFSCDKIVLNAVRARLGDRIFPGIYGQSRPDIAAHYPQIPQAEHCGFKIDLTLEPTDSLIVIEVGDEEGKWHRIFTERRGPDSRGHDYASWISLHDTLTSQAIVHLRTSLQGLKYLPLISVLMPVYNTSEKWLERAIKSVRDQIYERWELCIADDASTEPHVRSLLEKAAREDSRIKVVFRETNGHISAASNSALTLAQGDFVALLDHDDELRTHALAYVALELNRFPDANLIYSDEDKLDEAGIRYSPYFKPDWNPDLFFAQNFICHLGVYRTVLVREVGAFRIGYEGSQDWDLAMRVIEHSLPRHIRHIPRILYHWRAVQGSTALQISEKSYSVAAAGKAIADHFSRVGIKAAITPVEGDYWRVHYPLPDPAPRVTLIVPTRNNAALLRPCIASILEKTAYPDYEILVVDNNSDEPETFAYLDELRQHPRCRVLAFPKPFNFSAINNFAVQQTDSPIIGLLNNDLEVINGDWLDEMASQALRPEIGCVGAKLYYPDGRIQHAGVILGIGGVAGHAYKYLPRHRQTSQYRLLIAQNFSAVTAACLVIRRSVYLEAGGFDENIAVAFNDVDFCLKVRSRGYRNLYTPYAELYHHESVSRGYEDTPEKRQRFSKEVEHMQKKWGNLLCNDPAYNPNLTLEHEDFSLAFPPHVPALGQP
jgi:glycosyltransferase involved in cell wall biosynthesis